jgi:hypothetical protein
MANQMSGVVQLGGHIDVGQCETLGSGRVVCDLWADVIPHWGLKPVAGARWRVALLGANSVEELRIEARKRIDELRTACAHGLIVSYRGPADRYYSRFYTREI